METLNKLWQYNNWANQAVIHLFEKHTTEMPANCLHLFSHIVNTQAAWLSRMNGTIQKFGAWDDHTIETCKEMHEQDSGRLQLEANKQPDLLAEIITYKNSTGTTYQNSRHDILIHVFNHGTYHRAQIAAEMRKNGLEPFNTDYINFVRV